MSYEREAYMRRQEEDHDLIRMRQPRTYNSTGCANAMVAAGHAAAEQRSIEHAEIDRLREEVAQLRDFAQYVADCPREPSLRDKAIALGAVP